MVSARSRCVFAVAVILGPLVMQASANGTSPHPQVAGSFSNTTPEKNQKVTATACWSNTSVGEVVELDAGLGTKLKWRPIQRFRVTTPSGCHAWNVSTGTYGLHQFIVRTYAKKKVVAKGRISHFVTYGAVPVGTFFQSIFQCWGLGTVSNGTNVYPEGCNFNTGNYSASSPNVTNFASKTTCRSITVNMLATDNFGGDTNSVGSEYFDLIQATSSPQILNFGDNQVITHTFTLDGSAANVETWGVGDSNNLYYNRISILSTGSADCSSPSGV